MKAPRAEKRPSKVMLHGAARHDDYAWLQDENDPAVRAYLEAENAYTERQLQQRTGSLRAELLTEMKARVDVADRSVPVLVGDYWYYCRIAEGQQYWVYCRTHRTEPAHEEVLLDENLLAQRHEYVSVDGWDISPDHRWLAYTVDTTGDEQYALIIKDLSNERAVEEPSFTVGAPVIWANDNQTLFYVLLDEAQRPYRLMRHQRGSPPGEDVAVFTERDDRFHLDIAKTKSNGYLVLELASQNTSESWVLVADVPFVDVINTLLDPELPLSVIEWEEWGSPRIAEQYATLAAYSPDDNVSAHAYPAMLVTGAVHDSRVGFWEPAK